MYNVSWDPETGGILLTTDKSESTLKSEVRPVFFEELDLLGFDKKWSYPRTEDPLLWATGSRRYFYKGELVAEAKGGGFFQKPAIEFFQDKLEINPVAVSETLRKNETLMEGLEHKAIEFIYRTHNRFRNRVDISAVAFSGGKDSLVLLDLVQRTLMPDEFVVVFSDTTMA